MRRQEYFEERELLQADPAEAFAILRDVTLIPQWSAFIKSVTVGLDGWHTGVTPVGPVPFRWESDEGERKVTMIYEIMGWEIKSYFWIQQEEDKVYVVARWPFDPQADDFLLEYSRRMGKEEVRQLARFIEKATRGRL